jgi:hypothetical protein
MSVIRRGRLFSWGIVLGVLATMGALASITQANHNQLSLISTGSTGGNGAFVANFDGSSSDGSRAFIETAEKLVSGDTDSSYDVYERSGGTTTLVSAGAINGNGANDVFFDGNSADGTKVFFETDEKLASGDNDNQYDIYQRSGGVTTLISTGSGGGSGNFDAFFDGNSADGSRVFFTTAEKLESGDNDDSEDVYQRSGSTTTRISTGPAGGNAEVFANFDGASTDGTVVFFETAEALVSGDTDSSTDIYQRSGTTTTQVSVGAVNGNGAFEAFFDGNSADGSRVFFDTIEPLVAADSDNCNPDPEFTTGCRDIYERSGGTTSRVSTGTSGGNAAFDAFYDGLSTNGTKVFFSTREALEPGTDTDTQYDVYQRSGGTTTTEISLGSPGGNGLASANFDGASADGSRVFFDSTESLASGDADTSTDIFERSGGTTTRVSTGALGGNGSFPVFFGGASSDGGRVFFETSEKLEPGDTDSSRDVYERFSGATTELSIGAGGGNGAVSANFDGNSLSGGRVFFDTAESLLTSDTDSSRDVYMQEISNGYVRPKGATPILVALVPAFQPCTLPNSTHGSPLVSPSCNPPSLASGFLTVGSPDSNGKVARAAGTVRLDTVVGNPGTTPDEADVLLSASMTDVRRKSDLADYTGQLQASPTVRITDRGNGSISGDAATVTDMQFPFTVSCVATGGTTDEGSNCSVTTTADTVVPGAIKEGDRAVWELGQVRVFDGGADGVASTSPNSVFAVEGIFIP